MLASKLSLLILIKIILITVTPQLTESIAVMSIDLGTEFMKIGIVKPGVPMEIVLNKESRRKTPLIVSLRGTEREFGELAMSQAIKKPQTAYFGLTQILAKSLDSPAVQAYKEKYPFYNIKENPETKTIYFQHDDSTIYTPEELLAMILDYARELAADFGEQSIDAAVIAVPPYFNQAERKAVLRAADLVNLRVLQLINTNIAAGLNYGVFRRKDFNSTGTTLMFFDMGSTGTVATIATFQLVKLKEDFEANPQLVVRGVGFDQTLGGNAFAMRLAKHLAKLFFEKTKKDVFTNPKATIKIYKEAERVKNVLSANADHTAQIEGLMDDVDFKAKITRQEFEEMCADLFDRVKNPVQDALNAAEIINDEISAVILVGGGTRTPKIQDELMKATKKSELGKNLNTDESAALGAVYQAAFQSKGYKVKKFYIKDLNLYPIVVDFEKQLEADQTQDEKLSVRRTLFDKYNQFPQKKVMTFNKHTNDFDFRVNYGELTYLKDPRIGSLNISLVNVLGVGDIFNAHKNEESKGIKVHFKIDDSGVLNIEKIDINFERPSEPEESTLSKISNKISSFFGGAETVEDEAKKTEEPQERTENNATSAEKTKQTADESAKLNSTDANSTLSKNSTINITAVREEINYKLTNLDLIDLSNATIKESKKKLDSIKEEEKEKRKKSVAINSLEAFLFDTKDKLSQDDFIKCSTTTERETIAAKLDEVDLWLSEADNSVETKEYTLKLGELKKVSKEVFFRLKEKTLRPKRLDELKEVLNKSIEFLGTIKNLTGEDLPLTEVQYTTFEKLINSTKEWRVKLLNEQAKVADNQQPKLLTNDISDKIDNLKREVSYLVTKIKYFRPPTKKPPVKDDEPEKTKERKAKATNENTAETQAPNESESINEGENLKDENIDSSKTTPNSDL